MAVGGYRYRHRPAALPTVITRYPSYRSLGGSHGRSGRVQKISPPPGFIVLSKKYKLSILPGCSETCICKAFVSKYQNATKKEFSFTKS